MAVARAAAAVLIKLVPSKTVERSLSGRSIIRATRLAPLAPVLIRCSSLIRWRERKAVSELQKKADTLADKGPGGKPGKDKPDGKPPKKRK